MREFNPYEDVNPLFLVRIPAFINSMKKNKHTKEINLGDLLIKKCKIFAGFDEGASVRAHLNLNLADKSDEILIITIPEYVYSVNSSFFLGCFGPSVKTLGEELFKLKYIFDCDDIIRKNIDDGIERSIRANDIPIYDYSNYPKLKLY